MSKCFSNIDLLIIGCPFSKDNNLHGTVEDKIKKAYGELHRWKVLHGDVKASNNLVSYNESVHIIYFEAAFVGSDALLAGEMSEVERLLEKMKNEIRQ